MQKQAVVMHAACNELGVGFAAGSRAWAGAIERCLPGYSHLQLQSAPFQMSCNRKTFVWGKLQEMRVIHTSLVQFPAAATRGWNVASKRALWRQSLPAWVSSVTCPSWECQAEWLHLLRAVRAAGTVCNGLCDISLVSENLCCFAFALGSLRIRQPVLWHADLSKDGLRWQPQNDYCYVSKTCHARSWSCEHFTYAAA